MALIPIQEMVGNETLIRFLSNKPTLGSSIFSGPEGVGKKTFALALAARSNCRSSKSGDACGTCAPCLKVGADLHPDVRVIEPTKGLIRIAAVREMCRDAQYRPYEGAERFFIVDQAERLNAEAANALLKTLEEPPELVRIILITARPGGLLPTIRSRCNIYRFSPIPTDQIEAYLRTQGSQDVELRAVFSEGSLGRALSLDLKTIRSDCDLMLGCLEDWLRKGSFASLFERIEQEPMRQGLKDRERVLAYLETLLRIVEDLYYLSVQAEHRIVYRQIRDRLEALIPFSNLDWITQFRYHVGQAKWDIDHYVSPLMSFETLWLHCPRMRDHASNRHG